MSISVASIDAELDQATVRRLDDLQTYSPNLYIRRSPGIASGASITIRGIGTQDSDKSLDPAIGVMMDGVFLGTSSGVLMQNFDVKRVEVLRGPQGTLYGKNTTGGLINIIRGDVTMAWGGDFSITTDEYGREDLKAVVNVPVVDDKFGVKLFGAQVKSDGYVYNTTLKEDVGGDDVRNYVSPHYGRRLMNSISSCTTKKRRIKAIRARTSIEMWQQTTPVHFLSLMLA